VHERKYPYGKTKKRIKGLCMVHKYRGRAQSEVDMRDAGEFRELKED
jgi:hypothetical protein